MLSPEIERQISDRLADDLQVSDDRILNHGVRQERATPPDRVGFDPGNGIPDVLRAGSEK